MARMSQTSFLGSAILVAFAVSGCQSTGWSTAWQSKPKQQFQGVQGPDQVTYWPYKPGKNKQKVAELPDPLKEKIARNSHKAKREKEIADLVSQGDVLRRNGQFEQARMIYDKALLISPDNPDVTHRMAIVADMERQYSAADEYYQATLRARPRDANVLSDLGYSYILRGNNSQAEQTLKEALTIDPSHKGAMGNLGSLYSQQNRYPEALAMFRAGSTETDTQKYMAKLFPQDRSMAAAGAPMGQGNLPAVPAAPVVASSARENAADLASLPWKDAQQEMARRAQEAKQLRLLADQRQRAQYGAPPSGESMMTQQQPIPPQSTQQQQQPLMIGGAPNGPTSNGSPRVPLPMANLQPGFDGGQGPAMPATNAQTPAVVLSGSPQSNGQRQMMSQDRSMAAAQGTKTGTEYFRGSTSAQPIQPNAQVQQALGAQAGGTAFNSIQQINDSTSASQMVTQIGMSAGPGNMFPVVPASTDGGTSGEPATATDQRFGAEFQQAPSFRDSSNRDGGSSSWGASTMGWGGGDTLSLAPASPANNWDTIEPGAGNPQIGHANSSGWAHDTQAPNASASAFESPSNPGGWSQNDNRKSDGFDNFPSAANANNRSRNGNDGSRPFNGSWPSANSVPTRQAQGAPQVARAPETIQMMGNNPMNGGGMNSGSPSTTINQESINNPANNSLPQWPYAPNR